MRRIKGFTLVELLVVIIIVGILAAISIPMISANIIKSKMAELYVTVGSINTAENLFYLEHEFYAAAEDGIPGYDLHYSTSQTAIDSFKNVLGLEIPGMESIFVYGVYYDPAKIFVRVRDHFEDWWILCYIDIEGPNKGVWWVNSEHPWAKYLSVP